MAEANPLEGTVRDLKAVITGQEAKIKVLESQVRSLMNPAKPRPVKVDATTVLCSWFNAPDGSGLKCAWRGRADYYQQHLDQFHKGKDYVPVKVGIPVKEA